MVSPWCPLPERVAARRGIAIPELLATVGAVGAVAVLAVVQGADLGVSLVQAIVGILMTGAVTGVFLLYRQIGMVQKEGNERAITSAGTLGELKTYVATNQRDLAGLGERIDSVGSKIAAHTTATMTRIEERFERDLADVRKRLDEVEDRLNERRE